MFDTVSCMWPQHSAAAAVGPIRPVPGSSKFGRGQLKSFLWQGINHRSRGFRERGGGFVYSELPSENYAYIGEVSTYAIFSLGSIGSADRSTGDCRCFAPEGRRVLDVVWILFGLAIENRMKLNCG